MFDVVVVSGVVGFFLCYFILKLTNRPKKTKNIEKLNNNMISYTPKHFEEKNEEILIDFIEKYNFGMIITFDDENIKCSHLPFFIEKKNEKIFLYGHVAKGNSIFRLFERTKPNGEYFKSNNESLIIFNGPHGYISPNDYETQIDNVPTWNYTTVHCYGNPKMIQNENLKFEMMNKIVENEENKFKESNYKKWKIEIAKKDYIQKNMENIFLFEIEITKIEGKFKLSQNKPMKTRDRLINILKKRNPELSKFM